MQNLISFLGIFVFIFLAWTLSEDRKRFPWRVAFWGIGLQLAFAVLVFSWKPGAQLFLRLNDVFNALLNFSKEGALFVFGSIGAEQGNGAVLTLKEYLTRLGAASTDPSIQNAIKTGTVPGMFLAFQVLTTIIFFSALLSILYYLGIMQKIVIFFAKIMQHTMQVSGAEALSNSANIFVGQTEAPLVVKPYIEKMTRSELNAIMVGGFANTAGGVLGAYILMLSGYFPNIAAHLISASILSAPAAFIVAKIMVPEREKPATLGEAAFEVPTEDVNLLDAAASGSTTGLQLTLNVVGMLFSFVALIAMANVMVGWLGGFFNSTAGLVQLDVLLLTGSRRSAGQPKEWGLRRGPLGFAFLRARRVRHCGTRASGCSPHGCADRPGPMVAASRDVDPQEDTAEGITDRNRYCARGLQPVVCSSGSAGFRDVVIHATHSRMVALADCVSDGDACSGLSDCGADARREADIDRIRGIRRFGRLLAGVTAGNRAGVGFPLGGYHVVCPERICEFRIDCHPDWRDFPAGSVPSP
jgi:nucleoside transporter